MCLGIPGKIVDVQPTADASMPSAVVEFEGLKRTVCMALVPEALPGDFVIVHAGIAISRLDAEEAARLLEHLREMNEDEDWREAEHEVPR